MSETMPFREALARLSNLADRVEARHERIVVTRNGRPSFVLVSPDDLDALEEDLARALRRSHLTLTDGRWSARWLDAVDPGPNGLDPAP
jgi:prevent-host-death family protein